MNPVAFHVERHRLEGYRNLGAALRAMLVTMTLRPRLFLGATTALALVALSSFAASRTYATPARNGSGGGPADMVLIDNSCTMQFATVRPGEVKTAPGSENILVCWRAKTTFGCHLVTPDTKDSAFGRAIEFSILDEKSPLVTILSTAPLIMISVDWSTASFVLAQTSTVEGPAGKFIAQKLCTGQVMTGEAFAKGSRSGRPAQ
jgi:hypothetical protein